MNRRILIIGGGLAGSLLAYLLQDYCSVALLTKKNFNNSNSVLAQGGIASVFAADDSFNLHAHDTLVAGNFHNKLSAVKTLVEEGPQFLQNLIAEGLLFDKDEQGNIQYGMEGAHSRRRILHAKGDRTGTVITKFVQNKWQRIKTIESALAIDLIIEKGEAIGLVYLDKKGFRQKIFADKIVIATGGIGQLFLHTSNDETLTGDGLALAKRAGVKILDSEFIQFHPTILSVEGKCCGLISEVVRGEGAFLVNDLGVRFMKNRHQQADLAARDVVARAVYEENLNGRNVYLDVSKVENFAESFPTTYHNLSDYNFDIEKNPLIPIQSGAHFFMGGIDVDLQGRTTLTNLYALGEVACTGVHGANRLASNSLLEIIVFANHVARDILNSSLSGNIGNTELENIFKGESPNLPDLHKLKKKSWEAIGIVRKKSTIVRFLQWLEQFSKVEKIPTNWLYEEIITYNLVEVARMIAKNALARTTSLGTHYLVD